MCSPLLLDPAPRRPAKDGSEEAPMSFPMAGLVRVPVDRTCESGLGWPAQMRAGTLLSCRSLRQTTSH
jgi:hypothetical protein